MRVDPEINSRQAALGFIQQQAADQHFLVKPLDGSLGRGIQRHLTAAQAKDEIDKLTAPHLLEQQVDGVEYRVNVTRDRVVQVLLRRPASVVGDGTSSIRQLVETKNQQRKKNPVYRDGLIQLNEDWLQAHQLSADDCPEAGQRVFLSDLPASSAGGDFVDAYDQLPPSIQKIAVRATQALGLLHAGLDMIVTNPDPEQPQLVLLEANQNPFIRIPAYEPEAFPGNRNAIAESIIDAYFPSSRNNKRFPNASFDFERLCTQLRTAMLDHISLPVLGRHWKHQRYSYPAQTLNKEQLSKIAAQLVQLGVHVQILHVAEPQPQILIDLLMPEHRWPSIEERMRQWLPPATDQQAG